MEDRNRLFRAYYVAFFAMLLFSIAVLVLGNNKPEDISPVAGESGKITKWTLVREDGSREDIVLPYEVKAEREEIVTMEGVIPDDIEDNMTLHNYVIPSNKVYIDDELRAAYDRENSGVWGGTVSSVSLFLKLNKADAGKTVRVVFDDEYISSFSIEEFRYGEKLDVIVGIIHKYVLIMIIAMILMFMSIVIIIVDGVSSFTDKKKMLVGHLALGAFFMSCWILFGTRVFPIITDTIFISGTISFMAMMLIPIPVIIYINSMQKGRYSGLHLAAASASAILFVSMCVLHFTGFLSFIIGRPIIEIFFVMIVIMELVTIVLDIKNGHANEYRLIILGMAVIAAAVVMEVVQNTLGLSANRGFFLEIGLIAVLITGFLQQIRESHDADMKREQALAANESKTSFLASMSHEIRTPINSIIGMNEMIIRETRDPEIREYANQVDRSGKMLLGLINDVLDFSKIEAGKMTILDVPYQTAQMINDMIQLLNERTIAKSLKSGFDIARDIPKSLSGDEVHIKQIIVNLISNGVKYTKEGYVTLRVTSQKTKDPDMVLLKFVVSDSGIGIKKENIDSLFDKFTRLDEQRNRSIEGSGLGLSIVKNLVDEMHGTISVESEYGKGSSFTVEIPQKVSNPDPIGDISEAIRKSNEEATEYVEQFHASRAKVLIVDDNLVNLRVASELLKQTKMQIDTASDGRECIIKCRSVKYDLILMDHRMPDPDGVETLRLLREDYAGVNYDTKVIVLTANVFAGIREKYLADGFVDYLSKPIDSILLERCIMKHLDPALIDLELPEEAEARERKKRGNASEDEHDYACPVDVGNKMSRETDSLLRSAIAQKSSVQEKEGSEDKTDVKGAWNMDTEEVKKEGAETESTAKETAPKASLVERLRDVPGMDIDKTIGKYGSKDDFLNILFSAIVSDGRKKAGQMQKYLDEKDYKDFGIEAHATKSSMATIFAMDISERAKQHEFACKEERYDFVEQDGEAFVKDYLAFLDLIEKAMNGN